VEQTTFASLSSADPFLPEARKSHGYNGAAVILAGQLWQAFAIPVGILGTALFAFSSDWSLERFVAYLLWAGTATMLTIGTIHGV
jgi:hypothetical protein